VRAYATNEAGTAYGEDVSFTTLIAPGTTLTVSDITATTAIITITVSGVPDGADVGAMWDSSPYMNNRTRCIPVSPLSTFRCALTGLLPGTLYYVRADATILGVTSYGNTVAFTTLALPTVTTQAITNVLAATAVGNGNITSLGLPNPMQHGFVWGTTTNPTTADNKTEDGPVSATGAFTGTITGLTPNTLYHVRAYATNAAGTAYGEDVTFTTLIVPGITLVITDITTTTPPR
jgi:hypothetical protein